MSINPFFLEMDGLCEQVLALGNEFTRFSLTLSLETANWTKTKLGAGPHSAEIIFCRGGR